MVPELLSVVHFGPRPFLIGKNLLQLIFFGNVDPIHNWELTLTEFLTWIPRDFGFFLNFLKYPHFAIDLIRKRIID